eukprot:RCo030259
MCVYARVCVRMTFHSRFPFYLLWVHSSPFSSSPLPDAFSWPPLRIYFSPHFRFTFGCCPLVSERAQFLQQAQPQLPPLQPTHLTPCHFTLGMARKWNCLVVKLFAVMGLCYLPVRA